MIRPRPVYESLCTISWSFDQILQELESLQLLDGFRGQSPLKSVALAVKETHAWTMSEILDVLHQREESAIAPAAMDGGRRKIPVP